LIRETEIAENASDFALVESGRHRSTERSKQSIT